MSASPDLLSLVRTGGAALGESPFLAVGGASLTGARFAQCVETTAAGLLANGFLPGDRLAVLLHRCVDEAIAILAAAAAGGIAVPVNGKLRDDQIAHVLADAAPAFVVASHTRLLPLRNAAAVLHGQRLLCVGSDAMPLAATAFGELAALGSTKSPPRIPDTKAPAALLYTSGSTGPLKGIVQSHQNLCLGATIVAEYLALTPSDHVLAVLPFSFDYGLNQLLSALHAGCRVTAADHLGSGEIAALCRSNAPTGLAGVPSLWHEVARGLANGTMVAADGSSLRYITNSGGTLRPEDSRVLAAHWPHVRIYAMYGLTEAFRSAYLDPAEFAEHPDSFGRALPGVELLLVDPTSGEVLHGPATGELVHAGALVAPGYWRRPEATARRFRTDPRGTGGTAVYSGDLVRRDAAGRHYFVCRLDRQLKVQGHRVSPDEVAAAVSGVAGVGETAVFGLDGGADGHRIALVAAGDPRDPELPRLLLRACRQRLPSFMVPSVVRVLATMPHNANGKVDEPALRALIGPCTDTT